MGGLGSVGWVGGLGKREKERRTFQVARHVFVHFFDVGEGGDCVCVGG